MAGSIVVVDWRGGALPHEPGKLRLAVVVEDHEVFPEGYLTTLVVPLTRDAGPAHGSFADPSSVTRRLGATTRLAGRPLS